MQLSQTTDAAASCMVKEAPERDFKSTNSKFAALDVRTRGEEALEAPPLKGQEASDEAAEHDHDGKMTTPDTATKPLDM